MLPNPWDVAVSILAVGRNNLLAISRSILTRNQRGSVGLYAPRLDRPLRVADLSCGEAESLDSVPFPREDALI